MSDADFIELVRDALLTVRASTIAAATGWTHLGVERWTEGKGLPSLAVRQRIVDAIGVMTRPAQTRGKR